MKAVVFHGVGDIRLDDVAEPKIRDDNDAIVRLTASAICGTDLHFTRGCRPSSPAFRLPDAVRKVAAGELAPSRILTQRAPISDALSAYASFDRHEEGWMKVELLPQDGASGRPTRGSVEVKTSVKVT